MTAESEREWDAMMRRVTSSSRPFGHRDHLQVTWLAVRQFELDRAIELVSHAILRTARYAGAPQKYHATVSRAWVELVGHHASHGGHTDFARFIEGNPTLLDKRLLLRFYRSATLASDAARTGWVPPDLVPFPWVSGRGSA